MLIRMLQKRNETEVKGPYLDGEEGCEINFQNVRATL